MGKIRFCPLSGSLSSVSAASSGDQFPRSASHRAPRGSHSHGRGERKNGGRHTRRPKSAPRDRRKALAAALPDRSPGFLRRAKVTVQTQLRYRQASTAFRSFCAERALSLSSTVELDLAMQCYLEDLFLSGEGLFMARNAVYGEAFVRELDLRDRAVLRLSRDALLGWRKLCPESSRNPLPWLFACLIALHMCLQGGRPGIHAAACLVLQFDAYLRPSVAVLLRCENVVPPVRNVVSAYRRWALLLAPLEIWHNKQDRHS